MGQRYSKRAFPPGFVRDTAVSSRRTVISISGCTPQGAATSLRGFDGSEWEVQELTLAARDTGGSGKKGFVTNKLLHPLLLADVTRLFTIVCLVASSVFLFHVYGKRVFI